MGEEGLRSLLGTQYTYSHLIIGMVPISILKKKGVPLLNELHIFLREKTTQADTFGELRA